ncbi:MAG: hypothetical protein E7018_01815 [Alphaproteobacteria bacterium]|nr:hypothetical protein [Alphaproteobacteria bacterium]
MNKIVPPTLLSGTPIVNTDKPISAIPLDTPIEIKPGTSFFIETIINSDTFKVGSILTLNFKTESGLIPINVQLQTSLPQPPDTSTSQSFLAKAMPDGTIQLYPQKPSVSAPSSQGANTATGESSGVSAKNHIANSFAQSSDLSATQVIKTSPTNMPDISLHPIRLQPVVKNIMQDLNFPLSLQNIINRELPQVEVMLKLNSIGQAPVLDVQILQPLKNTLIQILDNAANPTQVSNLIQQLQTDIKSMEGQVFSAKVVPQPTVNATLFASELGSVWSEQAIKIPQETPVQMSVVETKFSNLPADVVLLKEISNILEKLVPSGKEFTTIPQTLLQSLSTQENNILAKVLNIFKPLVLVETNQTLASSVMQKLPGTTSNIFSSIHSFYKAAQNSNISDWLGADLISQLSSSPKGKEAITHIEQLLTSSIKDTPLWRVIDIPFFDGSQLMPMQISIKKDTEKENRNQPRKGGLRFMLETEFSNLGAFQFDGLSVAAERRFDLVIRTSRPQNADFCTHIINLFKKSLHDVDYIGSIKINQQEAFIKAEKPEKTSNKGVYI